eukprot:scaffold27470_cov100-Phaeocystis_antarctica.AAC.1
MNAIPLAQAGNVGPLAHTQTQLVHCVRGKWRAPIDRLGDDLRGGISLLAQATAARRRLRVVVGERAVVVRHCQLPARACLVRPTPLPRVVPPIDGGNLRRRAWQVRAAVRWHLEL